MPTITIPGTDVDTSPLGFGCAGLFREPTARQRRRLLDVAHYAGIHHFDVAPMYGLGLAERELGRFARGRRDRVVIATKFGIDPTTACLAIGRVQGPARRLLAAAPALRRRTRSSAGGPSVGRAGALLYRGSGFDATAARASLERSLRELDTDHVDLLLLHDPTPGDVRSDDVCGYLDEAREAGLIRSWGLTGEPEAALDVAEALPTDVPVLQVHHDVLMRSAASTRCASFPGRITYGVLGQALDTIVRHVGADAGRRDRWRDAIGCDCAIPEVAAELMLRQASRENPSGVVLFSTTREDRLRSVATALSGSPGDGDESLDAFMRLLAAEQPEGHPSPDAPE